MATLMRPSQANLDGKSHTGLVVQVGGAAVLCKSSKQKIITKDSTEAELVGASDMMNEIIKVREFMENQGYENLPVPKLFQDNSSAIKLMENGGSKKFRSKYMRVRAECLRDAWRVKNDVVVQFVRTGAMKADVFLGPNDLPEYVTVIM